MIAHFFSKWFSVISIPTHFTLLRIALVPFIIQSMIAQAWVLAAVLFVVAAVTDMIDGALARFLNKVTLLGSLLDPIADKLLLFSSFGCFALLTKHPSFTVPLWFVALIFVNEFILLGFSLYWGVIKKNISLKPTQLGRLVSLGQILFIGWLLVCEIFHTAPVGPFYLILTLVVLSRACVFIDYCFIAFTGKSLS